MAASFPEESSCARMKNQDSRGIVVTYDPVNPNILQCIAGITTHIIHCRIPRFGVAFYMLYFLFFFFCVPGSSIITSIIQAYIGPKSREKRRVCCCLPVTGVLVHYDSPKHMDERPLAWCKCEPELM